MPSSTSSDGATTTLHIFPKREAKIFGCAQVERIGQRYAQGMIAHGNRQRAMQSRQAAGNEPQDFRSDVVIRQLDEIRPERVGNDLIKAALIHKAAIDQGLLDGFAIELRFLQNVLDLRRLQHLLFDEDIGDLLRVHWRKRRSRDCRAFL